MRAHIAELPDGVYTCEDWLDNDGIVDEPLKIALIVPASDYKSSNGLFTPSPPSFNTWV
jgi:N-methylhydantoinase B